MFDLKNWLLTLSPILTIELTFACVPAAEGDQSDDTDEQDTASTHCSTNNYQHRQGFCNKTSGRKRVGVDGCQEKERDEMRDSRTYASVQERADLSKRKKDIH